MITVKRSPARVCWHVLCNGQCIATRNTKREANKLRDELTTKYSLKAA